MFNRYLKFCGIIYLDILITQLCGHFKKCNIIVNHYNQVAYIVFGCILCIVIIVVVGIIITVVVAVVVVVVVVVVNVVVLLAS